jgi:hypothetical protein
VRLLVLHFGFELKEQSIICFAERALGPGFDRQLLIRLREKSAREQTAGANSDK